MRTILLSLSNGRPVWHKWQLSPISSLPSFPPSGPLHHLCVMCVYKMLIERHSSSLPLLLHGDWGLEREGGMMIWTAVISHCCCCCCLSLAFLQATGCLGSALVRIEKVSEETNAIQ